MKQAQQAKADKALSGLIRHDGKVMTKREFIEHEHAKGATVKEGTKPAVQWNRTRFNRMNGWEQEQYEKRLAETKPCYKLYPKDQHADYEIYIEISKTEYDYFLSLAN